MLRPRIIPVLLLKENFLVKSVQFKNHSYIGDPLNAVKLFNDLKADELVFLDINASKNGTVISFNLIKEIGEEANMPFSVGGGINSLTQIENLIKAGAERVIIGNEALVNPEFINSASKAFGSSTITVCIDVKKSLFGKELIYSLNGKTPHKFSLVNFAKLMEQNGAGELIVQSIDRDGMMKGFEKELVKKISDEVTVPVIALGGAGNYSHLKDMYNFCKVRGIGSGSTFIYQSDMKGVLINYPTSKEKEAIYE